MRFTVFVPLLLATACGGQVRTVDEGDGSTPGAGGSDQTSGGGNGASTALPGCRPGFKPEEQSFRPCDFLADGRCYESKVDACACICPNKAGTTCTSGFPVPDGRVPVTCQ